MKHYHNIINVVLINCIFYTMAAMWNTSIDVHAIRYGNTMLFFCVVLIGNIYLQYNKKECNECEIRIK